MNQQNSDSSRKQEMSDAKRALLEKRLSGQLSHVERTEGIPLYEDAGPIPLSFAQERLWFLHQLEPQSPAYNMYNVVRIQGTLDKAILVESFNALIRRHHVLRSSFIVEGGQPYQKIAPEIHFEIPETTLPPHNQPDQELAVQKLIKAEIRRPFDLDQSPLLRALLVRQTDNDYILILSIHHIIFDEWSNGLFWRELSAIYQALSDHKTPALPDLPVQYTDFSRWQKRQIDEQMSDQLAYWRQQLSGELPLIQLPTDRPRPAQQNFRGVLKWRQLPEPLYTQLKSLNKELGTTMFMSLLVAFQLLLTRYTGQSDILVGTPIANRSRPETKGLIGLFLNTLVMRADLNEDMPFVDFASQARKAALDAYSHQDLPFEKLVDELNPDRDVSHNPIFQVMFVHQKSALEEIDLPGLMVSPVAVDIGVSKFDLTLFAQESDGNLSVGLEYNSDLFDKETADRILEHYQTLLESIVQDPQQKISDLKLIPAAERNTILRDWNNIATEPIRDILIHQLIEAQSVEEPDAVAVADETSCLSYRELDRRANQLAHYFQRLGVGPDVPVGLLLGRSNDMIVAILAVLKAGGAYLPLDPAYPQERLAFMLNDAQAPVILTHDGLTGSIPEHKAKTCFIDSDWDQIAQESDANPGTTVAPDNLAYIIYTSGSTGKPRGVPVSHRNLVHSTLARDCFYQSPADRFLLLSSFTFDSSIVGIFWTLCSGGKLVLPPTRIEQDMPQLAAIIADQGITHTLCLPSLYMLLLELADAAHLSTLQTVIVAGEACQPELVGHHFSTLPEVNLYNEYGPTETTVWSTAYRIPADFDGDRVPIGRPITNTQNYILDRHDQLAPIGVPGELCIGGAGVTSGYLNAPELAARKYIQRSFEGEAPIRLYRTGDRARYLPDGNIEFLGRIDHQVKIRGNRVELGEIESALRRMPGVKDAIVDAQDDRLIAFVIPDSILSPPTDWHAYLADYLPDYMIPTSYVNMEAFPRTLNGKLDRNALPVPQSVKRSDAFVAPTTTTEQTLAEIWADILGIERVGVHDNFFDLGGNSILSIRIFARIADQFEVNLPLSVLFTETTVEQLAARISEQMGKDETWPVLVPIQPLGSKAPFFCVHGNDGDVIGYRDLVNALGDDLPFLGLQSIGQGEQETHDSSIETMASRYIDAMRSYQPSGPYRIGGYCFGGVVAYEMAVQLEKIGEKVSLLAVFEGDVPHEGESRIAFTDRLGTFRNNLSFWIKDYKSMSPGDLLHRLRITFKRVSAKLRGNTDLERQARVEEIFNIDFSNVPDRNVELINVNTNALLNYEPQKYNGLLTLFRARNQSINEVVFGSLDPEMGWGRLATGGVDVRTVDGSHRNLHLAPYVNSLATDLKQCLDDGSDDQRAEKV